MRAKSPMAAGRNDSDEVAIRAEVRMLRGGSW